jgi:cysteine synthase
VEKDGLFLGSSSAVNCVAAVVTALNLPKGSTVVTILCDSGTRHMSKFYRIVAEMGLEKEEKGAEDLPGLLGALNLEMPKT